MRHYFILILVYFVVGCSMTRTEGARFTPTTYDQIAGWRYDKHLRAWQAFLNSCEKIMERDPNTPISKQTSIGGISADWQNICAFALLANIETDNEARLFFEQWFRPYYVTNLQGNSQGTLTGYYEIEMDASKKPSKEFKHPIYAAPHNLNDIKGLVTSEDIHNGALSHAKPIAWTNSKSRLYFMQIQGSGRLRFRDGSYLRVGYGGHNGYRFQGISKKLKEHGANVGATPEVIDWLEANKHLAHDIITSDPSYVFFQPHHHDDVRGAQGVPLTVERSIAADPYFYPYGTLIWVNSNLPATKYNNARSYNRLMVVQDTGGAIKGAIRADVFFGHGYRAEYIAGSFKVKGSFYALFPKNITIPERYH